MTPVNWPSLGFGGGSAFVGVGGEIDSAELMHYAWSRGLRYFDTSPYYGRGLSEHRFGAALRHYPRDEFLLSTKVGRMLRPNRTANRSNDQLPFDVAYDYGYDAVMRSIEDSLQRLGLARIDIAYIHDLTPSFLGDEYERHFRDAMDGGYRALDGLRSEGVLRAIGAGMKDVDVLLRIVQAADLDCVMLAGGYTLLDQTSNAELLPHCRTHDIAVVLASPFNSGVLAVGAVRWRAIFLRARAARCPGTNAKDRSCVRASWRAARRGSASVSADPSRDRQRRRRFSHKAEVDTNLRWREWSIPPALWDELRAEALIA